MRLGIRFGAFSSSHVQAHSPLRHNLSRLCVAAISRHSLCTATCPRRINRSHPPDILDLPKDGFHNIPSPFIRSHPRLVRSLRSMRSMVEIPLGIRPRGGPFSRSSLRCFQSFVVAIKSSGPSGFACRILFSL